MASLAATTCAILPATVAILPCKITSVRSSKRSLASSSKASSRWVMSAAPNGLDDQIRKGIKEAETVCADPNQTEECAVAWDEVEELSAAAADISLKNKQPEVSDPLEVFCADNPESDECRVYQD